MAEAAGDALFALLVELGVVNLVGAPEHMPLHFVGHGTGAVVVSEAIERLGAYDLPVDHLTYLDPHDYDQAEIAGDEGLSGLGKPTSYGAAVWDNVVFADAYYQTRGSNGILAAITAESTNSTFTADDIRYFRLGMSIVFLDQVAGAVLCCSPRQVTAVDVTSRVVTYSGTDLGRLRGPTFPSNWRSFGAPRHRGPADPWRVQRPARHRAAVARDRSLRE